MIIMVYDNGMETASVTNIDGDIYCTVDGKYAATIVDEVRAVVTDLVNRSQIGDYQLPQIEGADVKYIFNGPEKFFLVCQKDTLLKLPGS